jgi:hypothetical protein
MSQYTPHRSIYIYNSLHSGLETKRWGVSFMDLSSNVQIECAGTCAIDFYSYLLYLLYALYTLPPLGSTRSVNLMLAVATSEVTMGSPGKQDECWTMSSKQQL